MAKKIVCCKECGKPARDWDEACRYCGTALPVSTVRKCATCGGAASPGDVGCGHCGAASVDDRDPSASLVRCSSCAKPVSSVAAKCPRCKIAPPAVGTDVLAPPTPRPAARSSTAAPLASPEVLAAVVSGTPMAHVDLTKIARESASSPAATGQGSGGLSGSLAPASARHEPADEAATANCPVCRTPVTQSAEMCPGCGLRLRAPDAAVPLGLTGIPWWIKYVGLATVLLGILVGNSALRAHQADTESEERLRLAVADEGTPDAVAAMRRRAKMLNVGETVLIRIKRLCFLSPDLAPSDAELAVAAQGKTAAADREKAILAAASSRCTKH